MEAITKPILQQTYSRKPALRSGSAVAILILVFTALCLPMEGQEASQFIFRPEILSHDSLFPSDETESLYYHEAIILNSTSRLTLDYADDPALDMFEDSFALFLENRGGPFAKGLAALLKSWLQGTHQGSVQPSHLDYYLDEFTFRFNRRTSRSRGKLFYRFVQQAVAHVITRKRCPFSSFELRNITFSVYDIKVFWFRLKKGLG